MLQIGKLTDYALLLVGEMAKHSHETMSASYLAEKLYLSLPTVSKILKKLAEAKLVQSIRGINGGYYLASLPENIRIMQIITAMEGPMALTVCCELENHCKISVLCHMRNNWQKINKMIYQQLEQISILDMMGTLPISVVGAMNHG